MAKKSLQDQIDPKKLAKYKEELREFFPAGYPSTLLVKGDRIRSLRAWLGKHEGNGKPITQQELAKRAGLFIEQSTIQRYEKQHKEAPTLHLWAIARSCGVPLHEIAHTGASLPPPIPGSALYRAKIFIIKSWLQKTLPEDPTIDLRRFVDREWDDPQYRELISLTRNQEAVLWHSLAEDGWVLKSEDGQFHYNDQHRLPVVATIFVRLGHNMTNLAMELVATKHAAFANARERIDHSCRPLANTLLNIQSVINETHLDVEYVVEALRDCDLAFSNTDTVATNVTLLYHVLFSQWVDVTTAMLNTVKDNEQFNMNTCLIPAMRMLYKHRESLFYLFKQDEIELANLLEFEEQYRADVTAFLAIWDNLRKHLADTGILSGRKPDGNVVD